MHISREHVVCTYSVSVSGIIMSFVVCRNYKKKIIIMFVAFFS